MNAPSVKNFGMGSQLYPSDLSNPERLDRARFRVWAPNAGKVQVVLDYPKAETAIDLEKEPNGSNNWSAEGISAIANCKYQYRITTAVGPFGQESQPVVRTDARALQVEGSDRVKKGYVVDPALFTKNRVPFATPPFQDFLIYQLHVGSFTGHNDPVNSSDLTSTFIKLKDRLPYIRSLGFNAVQLLPIADFLADVGKGAGEGYSASDLFASENLYATQPERAVAELIELIDTAHMIGLAVILDVVYNHAAQQNNRYWQYDGNSSGDDAFDGGNRIHIAGGPYFVHGHHTRWGEGFATWQHEVKDLLLDNARMYLRDYLVDGLRFDAVQAMDPDAVRYIVGTIRNEFPDKYLIAEYSPDDSGTSVTSRKDPYGDLDFCATWDMDSPWETFGFLRGDSVVQNLRNRIGDFMDPNPWHTSLVLTMRFITTVGTTTAFTSPSASVAGSMAGRAPKAAWRGLSTWQSAAHP
jgi:1,4-alpha-glucan branching enzyme